MRRIYLSILMSSLIVLTLTACSAAQDFETSRTTVFHNSQLSVAPDREPSVAPDREPSVAPVTESAGIESDNHKTDQTPSPIVEEEDVRYVSMYADKIKSYNNINDLDARSELVFTGECISADPVFQNTTLYTLSKIKVDEVFKGNISSGDMISFVEVGGRVTNAEYSKGCELGEKFAEGTTEFSEDQKLVVGIDGFFPFQEGEKALLFACDVSGFLEEYDEPLYDIIGGWDGKLFAQEDGSFERPLAAETDQHVFGDNSLIITMDELKLHYQ